MAELALGDAPQQHLVDDPFTFDGVPPLPPLNEGEYDLLSNEVIDRICHYIAAYNVSAEIASKGAGIPFATLQEYRDVGSADLAAGFPTRKAILAKALDQAEFRYIVNTLQNLRSCPVGWAKNAWELERALPHHFSEKRVTKNETKQSAAMEALQRQLGAAMTGKQLELPRPKES